MLQAKGLGECPAPGRFFVPLKCAQIANAAQFDFLSIHFNATNDDPNATGFEIFRSPPRRQLQPPTAPWLPVFETRNPAVLDAQSLLGLRLSFAGHIPEFDRGITRSFAVLPTKASGADRRRVPDGARRKQIDSTKIGARDSQGQSG
jgi:hypothetical protein